MEIYEIRILEVCLPRVRMEVSCSKGTYIRTLCHDIGEKLGCHGCMESLLRTKAGRFLLKDSCRLEQVEELRDEGRLDEIILPVDQVFASCPETVLRRESERLGYNGNAFAASDLEKGAGAEGQVRVYDQAGTFIGLYEYRQEKHLYCPVKMFYEKRETP